MKITIALLTLGIIILIVSINFSEPGFNGGPGCDGGGCHTLQDGLISITTNGLQVQVSVSGTSSKVGGELVDTNGTVVAVINSTSTNPFTLDAPGLGLYRINAGFKNPSRRWDSSMVNISVTELVENITTPASFKLYNNHPNPFNPSTLIRYSIASETYTLLIIYDSEGQEVIRLVDEVKQPGTYQIIFNGSGLASGVYFSTLRAGSYTQTIKMNLTK